jgi:streptogramin lyase
MRRMRRALALTGAALVLAVAGARLAGARPPFSDLNGHWSAPLVTGATEAGWIAGYPDGTFRPDGPVTRAEFYKMLAAALGQAPRPSDPPPFAEADHWSVKQGWLQAAFYAGVLNPADYGASLKPDRPITRQEALIATLRAMGREGIVEADLQPDLKAKDAAEMPLWLQRWADVAVANGLVKGYEDGALRLRNLTTRAEALTLVDRAVDAIRPAITAFEGKAPHDGVRYPTPGEPVWYQGDWQESHPTVVGGSTTYVLPEGARGVTIHPAPGGAAWIGYFVDGTADQVFAVFAWAKDGKLTEARRTIFTGAYQTPLSVDSEGRLTFADGDALKRLARDGVIETLSDNLPLWQATYTTDGTLWGVGPAGKDLLIKRDAAGHTTTVKLPVGQTESIHVIYPGPDGSIWALIWDAQKAQTRAVQVKDESIQRDLVIMPPYLHGRDPMPVRVVVATSQELWIARMTRTGESSFEETGLFRFDLKTGALEPFVAPQQLEGPFTIRPSVDGGALLGDGAGRSWQIIPKPVPTRS